MARPIDPGCTLDEKVYLGLVGTLRTSTYTCLKTDMNFISF